MWTSLWLQNLFGILFDDILSVYFINYGTKFYCNIGIYCSGEREEAEKWLWHWGLLWFMITYKKLLGDFFSFLNRKLYESYQSGVDIYINGKASFEVTGNKIIQTISMIPPYRNHVPWVYTLHPTNWIRWRGSPQKWAFWWFLFVWANFYGF